MKIFAAVLILALAAAVAPQSALGAAPVPYLPVPRGAAVILNTGSTNSAGYRIVVTRSGAAEYIWGDRRATTTLPSDVTAQFYKDLEAGMPLSSMHVLACMKSASFGYSLFAWWRGQRSHDISCPGDAHADALAKDVAAIADALHLAAASGHPIHMLPNEARKPVPSPAPSGMGSLLSVRYTVTAPFGIGSLFSARYAVPAF